MMKQQLQKLNTVWRKERSASGRVRTGGVLRSAGYVSLEVLRVDVQAAKRISEHIAQNALAEKGNADEAAVIPPRRRPPALFFK